MIQVTVGEQVLSFDAPVACWAALKAAKADGEKKPLAAKIDGEKVVDLGFELAHDCRLDAVTFDDDEGRRVLRHTASHVLAMAVKELFPQAKLAIGPAIEEGFYYDFDIEDSFTTEQLAAIEKKMAHIIKQNLRPARFTLPREEALQLMRDKGEPYKVELIEDLPVDAELSFYQIGDFVDLCAGPHLPNVNLIKAFKLTQVAGAYWRGSEKNKMLKRIYGTAYDSREALEAHLKRLEDIKKRDHNRIGRDLEYFTTVDYIGQGLPIMLPKGARVIQLLQRFVEDEEQRRGYLLTKTPFMAKRELYKISGHWDHYRDGMFIMADGDPDDENAEVFALRPMTCPFQFQVYLNRTRSYRDLPMRLGETSTLFRNEASGEMHGLIRVRQFTISEGHLACTPDQVEGEFRGCLDLALYFLKVLGLDGDVSYRFSKWDENDKDKYIGDPESWEKTQDLMRGILQHIGIPFKEASGEAAFYGPKLDIQIKNVYGKEDTLITIQIDFQLAERYGMVYTDSDGQKKFPIVLHRTSMGCYERTLALLLEKYAGAMPTWLAPEQARVLTITERQDDWADEVLRALEQAGLRATCDKRNEKIGFKVREAQTEKIPYMMVLGDQEVADRTVTLRGRKGENLGAMPLADAVEMIAKLAREHVLDCE